MANFNFNKVILGGRLCGDPELKTTESGIPVTSFSIAVNRRGKDAGSDFISCTAWRGTAEHICRYFKKGSSICAVGEIHVRKWTDKDGNKRYVTEVVIDEVNFVDSKGEAPEHKASENYIPDEISEGDAPKFEVITDDDELPF